MKSSVLKVSIIAIFLAALTAVTLFVINQRYQTTIVEIPKFNHQTKSTAPPQAAPIAEREKNNLTPNPKPPTLLLKVPFTPQAPTANWDQLHNEACEEASAIMVAEYFYENKNIQLDPELVEGQIQSLTKWQQENFGYYLDATSAETAQMIEKVYNLKTKLIQDFSADDIKNELAQNHLVLISEYGRALGNPYYKRPGPIHHMLVIKGYNSAGFITNDPGTKRGLNYLYDFKTLYNAAADWSHEKGTVDETKKIAIIVWK